MEHLFLDLSKIEDLKIKKLLCQSKTAFKTKM